MIRGLAPWPSAYTFYKGEQLKIWKADKASSTDISNLEKIADKKNGEIVYVDSKKGLFVKTGDGILLLTEVQALNGKRMHTADYLRGHKLEVGEVLSNLK